MADLISIGVLVPFQSSKDVLPPEERPVGRAAMALLREGIEVVFGDQMKDGRLSGLIARPGQWVPIEDVPVRALHDRFPSQRRSEKFAEILTHSKGIPMGNPLSMTLLCRDKVKSQAFLEQAGINMPPVESDPREFESRLDEWGSAFLKPRYGALGTGVQRVIPGSHLPERLESVVPGRTDPAILQKAIDPPSGWAGRVVRVLCQRDTDGRWIPQEPVVRQSRIDPVVNAARGAQVRAGSDCLRGPTRLNLRQQTLAICGALTTHATGELLVEVGLDFVLDPNETPHLIEVNSRPRGRLEVLASRDPDRFMSIHVQACMRPIRRLARLVADQ